jgi:nucleoside-diphosphate-sugar epimerase
LKILVTGIAGAIGSNIFENLSLDSTVEVWGICRDKFSFTCSFNPKYPERIVELDLSKKQESLLLPEKFDLLIHAAAITPNSKRDKFDYLENLSIARNIAELSKTLNVERFFMLSTGSVYKNNYTICNENSEIDELNSYGKSMFDSEKIIQNDLINVTVFRLFYVYGIHYNNDTTLVNKLRKRIANNCEVSVSERLDTDEINPLYFDDLMAVLRKFFTSNFPNDIYNLAGPNSILFKHFLQMITTLENKEVKIVIDKKIQSPLVASTNKVNRYISKDSFTTFEQSILKL